jgi:hypothetical protein
VGLGTDGDADAGPKGAGAVVVLLGSSEGMTDSGAEFWVQDAPGINGLSDLAEPGDAFGYSLAVGDFDGNGADDLAIGVPFEGPDGTDPARREAGAVHVVYGVPGQGLGFGGPQFWHQDSSTADGTVADAREAGDAFGLSLAAGDLDGDGCADLVVGVPYEDVSTLFATIADAGAVHVLYGRQDGGLSLGGNQYWHQDSSRVTDTAETGDLFAMSLAIGDFNGDAHADLAIGVPAEGITSAGAFREHAGAVSVLHGSASGVTAADDAATLDVDENDQFWHQNSTDVADTNERHDHFGGGRAGQ